jgi:hypothetical protein
MNIILLVCALVAAQTVKGPQGNNGRENGTLRQVEADYKSERTYDSTHPPSPRSSPLSSGSNRYSTINNEKPTNDESCYSLALNALLVIVTSVIAVYGIRQYRNFRENGMMQLRAYISVEQDLKWPSVLFHGCHVHGFFNFVNNGQTPASSVESWCASCIEAPQKEQFPPNPDNEIIDGGTIHKGKTGLPHPVKTAPITSDEIAKIRLGELVVYFWGSVGYEDAFGKRQYTPFSYIVRWDEIESGLVGPFINRMGDNTPT